MRKAAAFFSIALALGAITLTPGLARAQHVREEGPIEIEKCQTISQPGSYKLVNNLVSPGGDSVDCLAITADFVTIDLAGFNISAASLTAGGGIVARPSSGSLAGIVVRNGSIAGTVGAGFFAGVDLSKASDSIVEGLRVVSCGRPCGGISATGIVKGNTVSSTGGPGIVATGVITGNYAFGNAQGFQIGEGSTVIGNTAFQNERGIFVACPSNLTDNTSVNSSDNLVLNGNGCNNTNNVAP